MNILLYGSPLPLHLTKRPAKSPRPSPYLDARRAGPVPTSCCCAKFSVPAVFAGRDRRYRAAAAQRARRRAQARWPAAGRARQRNAAARGSRRRAARRDRTTTCREPPALAGRSHSLSSIGPGRARTSMAQRDSYLVAGGGLLFR